MDAAKGKVVLFGKTGDGKSTVSNALVTGGIEDLIFKIGHGLMGCTAKMQTFPGRGWTVTDTVGLGEGEKGTVSNDDAEKMTLDFLKRVKGEYSHVIYVKSAANRFDVMDETIWLVFKRIFKGAEGAFTILFTKGNVGGECEKEEWLDRNWDSLPDWVKDLKRENVLITDIPPVAAKRPIREQKNKEIRRASIQKLEEDLLRLRDARGGRYFAPDISNMNDQELTQESRSMIEYFLDMCERLIKSASRAVKVVESALTMVDTLARMFE